MAKDAVVVLKAYRSFVAKDLGMEPRETREARTLEGFDRAYTELNNQYLFVYCFDKKSGAQLESANAARKLLE